MISELNEKYRNLVLQSKLKLDENKEIQKAINNAVNCVSPSATAEEILKKSLQLLSI